ncbi:MAG TPA: preprotein translocase subunit SecE [Marinospirillum sp.]|uniref:preprotein translocase subunit SecE n=1 Tax=Marinospirillum sp. TaxID=2183934 RepID=UPI002B4A796B|nr:preprotein translocase subunit SecE [Marinospirillum sp.]HKM15973.1 preprotein translocase subunit SecE [Marinospirillum sp.]
MKAKAEAQPASLDVLKWFAVLLLVAVAVAGNMYYADAPMIYRVIGVVLLCGMAGVVFLRTAKGLRLIDLAHEAKIEIRKVVWPTRPETIQTTLIVLAAVVIVAFLLWLVDSMLSWAIKSLIY